MPKNTKTPEPTLEETIILTLEVINAEIPDFDAMRKYVCPFYQGGNHVQCMGCSQPDDKVLDCGKDYAEKITVRPMKVWSKEFDALKVREKVSLVGKVEIGLYCDRCYMNEVCPMYEKMSLCSIDFTNPDVDASSPNSIIDYLVKLQMERIERAKVIEQIDGGVPDMTLSGEMDRLSGLLAQKADINTVKFKMSMEGSAPATGGGQGGGILSQIFGGLNGGNKSLPETTNTNVQPPTIEIKEPEFIEEKQKRKK